ncbi:MAG TPA: hypothetical protein ENK78_06075, partial [Thiothrix sp.]|nr:hypothetical protein [Thiothrix sp.]
MAFMLSSTAVMANSSEGEMKSFRTAKKLLAEKVYHDHRLAFYSGCRFRKYQKRLMPVLSSCGYKIRKNETRAKRIEWEHVMPAWVFGHQLRCWQNGGRENCKDNDPQFRTMEGDMHNLVPAIGEINGDRSNFSFRMLEGEPRIYGENINMEVDFKGRDVEPPDEVWGDIARTYFYMRDRYGLRLSSSQQKLMQSWNKLDPVDQWEIERNQRIAKIQGNDNPYVSNYRTDIAVKNSSDSQAGELSPALLALLAILYWVYRRFFSKN